MDFELHEPFKFSICVFCSQCADVECKLLHQFKECFDEYYDLTRCSECQRPKCFQEIPCKSPENVV